MAEFQAIFDKQDLSSLDDAKIFMEEAAGKSFDDFDEAENDDPCYLAQQLVYDAMEASSDKQALQLAREALSLDPGCVDALAIVAQLTRSPTKRLVLFEEAVKVGEERLGEDFFAANKGHFWGILETRPYMRAKKGLADELLVARRPLDAMSHLEEMLELCPNDNMGNRFDLMETYLMTDHLEQALDLLNRYSEGFSAIWNWSAVLVHFLLRDFDAATRSLKEARKQNRYVEPYLSGKKRIPDVDPEFYTVGTESEAIVCANLLAAPWSLHPVAVAWLISGGRPGDGRYCGILTNTKR
ncbi:MAG TPA: hypothetical protein VML01_01585 [Bryobacterales bacterium]|nr:hypothetical protein [Bryobacterales bacterium]